MKLRNKKTGEIGKIGYIATDDGQIIVEDISGEEYPYSVICSYETLAELNEEWEDYKPKEALIKDEKIRKAVRAWAEANEINKCKCNDEPHCITFETERGMFISFEYAVPIPPVGSYTIAELCGDDE